MCDYYDVVTELNASTGASNGTYTVGEVPDAICFDGASIWVANQQDATVTKLNAGTGATIGTYNVGSLPRCHLFRRSQHLGGEVPTTTT